MGGLPPTAGVAAVAGGRGGDPPRKSRPVAVDAEAADRSHLPPGGVARSSRAGGCSSPVVVDVGGSQVAVGGGGGEVAGTGMDPVVAGARSNRAEAGTHPEACTGPGMDCLREA